MSPAPLACGVFACNLVLPRRESLGYVEHPSIENARTEARYWLAKGECSAVEIVHITSANRAGVVVERVS